MSIDGDSAILSPNLIDDSEDNNDLNDNTYDVNNGRREGGERSKLEDARRKRLSAAKMNCMSQLYVYVTFACSIYCSHINSIYT